MKPRVLVPKKILAGVIVAVAGCTPSISQPTPTPASVDIATAVAAEDPPPTPAAVPAATASAATSVADETPRPPLPPGSTDPALNTLLGELMSADEAHALASMAHFRPLCDQDGYPLVGNIARKVPGGYQPSQFCASVRKAKVSR